MNRPVMLDTGILGKIVHRVLSARGRAGFWLSCSRGRK